MLVSCSYCGRIHDKNFDCGKRPQRIRYNTDAVKFRNTSRWQKKSREIRERDNFLCQCCIREFPGTFRKFEYDGCSVHHNVPLSEDISKGLDNTNLITLCSTHHEMAERGEITRDTIQAVINEQEHGTGHQES